MKPRDSKETLLEQLRALANEDDVDPDFTARVMAGIERPGLWAQIRELFKQPGIRRLATATSIPVAALIAFLAVSFVTRPSVGSSLTASAAVAVDYESSDLLPVEFRFSAPDARTVSLSGDFNQWATDSIPLRDKDGNGLWSVTVPLRPGQYAYHFVIDGAERAIDPEAAGKTDGPHGPSTILRL